MEALLAEAVVPQPDAWEDQRLGVCLFLNFHVGFPHDPGTNGAAKAGSMADHGAAQSLHPHFGISNSSSIPLKRQKRNEAPDQHATLN